MTNQENSLTRKEREEAFRRDLVLDVAERLFAEKGFDGTTVADIAERSELAKGSLYHLFQSKEEIIGAIIQRKLNQVVTDLNEIFSRPLGPLEKIRAVMRAKLIGVWESRHFARIFLHELRGFHWSTETPLLNTYREQIEGMMRKTEEEFAQGQKQGQFRDDIPASTLLAVMAGFSNAIIYTWLKAQEDFNIDVALDQAFKLFMHGVSPVGEGE